MSFDNTFPSLRLNRQDGPNQEGFWPSLTNIMSVIVMIFLIALVTLLIRNVELVKQLRITLESERVAAELARATGEEKETLALKLNEAENDLSMLRMQLMRLEEERNQQETTITSQTHQITGQTGQISKLTQERELLQLRAKQLDAETARLAAELETATGSLAGLRKSETGLNQARKQLAESEEKRKAIAKKLETLLQNHEGIVQQLAESQKQQQTVQKELTSLQQNHNKQAQELSKFRTEAHQSGRELKMLQSEHDQLKGKFEKLVKPARSPLGKTVVNVRYSKDKNRYRIEYKAPGSADFSLLNRAELNGFLDELKAQHPNGLYIKVILPKKSGLSHNEAWSFTKDLHDRYDYYFQ